MAVVQHPGHAAHQSWARWWQDGEMGHCHVNYTLTVLVELSENFVFILQLRHFEFTFQRLFNFDSHSKLQIHKLKGSFYILYLKR